MVGGIAVQGLVARVNEHKARIAQMLQEACDHVSVELRQRNIDSRTLHMFI